MKEKEKECTCDESCSSCACSEQDASQQAQEEVSLLEKCEEYKAIAQRVQADFENYRKRNISMRADALSEGKRDVITALLPVLDDLERALGTCTREDPLHEGVMMIDRKMRDELANFGFEEVPALGEIFDPEKHNAISQTPAQEGQEPGTIVEVYQKGYRAAGRIIRYAMVRVCN